MYDINDVQMAAWAVLVRVELGHFGFLLSTVEALAYVTAHVFTGMGSAFSLRRIEHFPKFRSLRPIDGVAYCILGGCEAASSNLGFDPLSGVWRQFDFHGSSLFDFCIITDIEPPAQ
jgi:hypothetical protein